MILLPVDEAYAFDFLSILYVKLSNSLQEDTRTKIKTIINVCENKIKEQIDLSLWNQLISSTEFKNMILVNQEVFNAVEKARYGEISAKEVDIYNMKRFIAKNEFQKKYFPNKDITEWKS